MPNFALHLDNHWDSIPYTSANCLISFFWYLIFFQRRYELQLIYFALLAKNYIFFFNHSLVIEGKTEGIKNCSQLYQL
jgi:hypothetical protein